MRATPGSTGSSRWVADTASPAGQSIRCTRFCDRVIRLRANSFPTALGCPEVDFGPATVLENDRVNAVAEPSMTNSLHEIFRKQRWHIDLRAVFCPRLS